MGADKSFITDAVRTLDHTEAFEFLDVFDDEIKNFAKNVIGRENPNLGSDEIARLANDFLYGSFDNAANITKGLWGEISERFALQTKGNVVTHIGDINGAQTRVWWNVEMPTILQGEAASINGIPKHKIVSLFNELGGDITDYRT